ncbi:four helix bundle protein [bacterium (Candidatus Howlettbacteria) CG_4_10_14_0_8_um_filter_40_9]|nr:MAG: four helix bundle protein [bacterium (Candidatus Howlettbacteria) CG_4_10_14_0_8_um_filter_40_9]
MGEYQTFENLNIWIKSKDLTIQIYELSKKFPEEERYGLISQIRRSASSIPANIAESQGRFHFSETINFLLIARGSLEETRSHLMIAKELNYISDEAFLNLNNEYLGLLKGLNVFIKSLRSKKSSL